MLYTIQHGLLSTCIVSEWVVLHTIQHAPLQHHHAQTQMWLLDDWKTSASGDNKIIFRWIQIFTKKEENVILQGLVTLTCRIKRLTDIDSQTVQMSVGLVDEHLWRKTYTLLTGDALWTNKCRNNNHAVAKLVECRRPVSAVGSLIPGMSQTNDLQNWYLSLASQPSARH